MLSLRRPSRSVLPGKTFGSWYCQRKQPVITRDTTRKNTRPTWLHFTFMVLLLETSSKGRAAAGGAGATRAGFGFNKTQKNLWSSKSMLNSPSSRFFSNLDLDVLLHCVFRKAVGDPRHHVSVALHSTHHLTLPSPDHSRITVNRNQKYSVAFEK